MVIDVVHLLPTMPSQAGVAVLVAIGSSTGFAVSNALQHRVAGTVPPARRRPLSVLGYLVRRRLWLLATAVSFTALLLHAAALHLGSIALVQPLMLVGVVLAVPLRAALEHSLPTSAEVRAVVVTTVGLALFLACSSSTPSRTAADKPTAVALTLLGVSLTLLSLRASARRLAAADPRLQAAAMGISAGVMFGFTAGLLKLLGAAIARGSAPATLGILAVLLVGAGVLGTAMNQRAYQLAPLAFSMPLVNVVDILVALGFGQLVFHEAPGHLPLLLALQALGLACVALGLGLIARLTSDGAGAVTPARGTPVGVS